MKLLRLAIPLLVLAGVALILSVVEGAGDEPLPPGSTYSYEPAGARALSLWIEALGGEVRRIDARPLSLPEPGGPGTIFLLQPETFVSPAERAALERAARRGAVIVIAGDSAATRALLLSFGVTLEPVAGAAVTRTDTREALPWQVRNRVQSRDPAAERLLGTTAGDAAALRQPFQEKGSIIALGDVRPFTNEGLRNPAIARWVLHELVEPSIARGDTISFDETHFPTAAPATANPPHFRDLLLATPAGRALLLAAALTFLYLLLSGRRLGPALPPAGASRAVRTMREQVQAIAGLYRRGRQLGYVREHYERHYRRTVSRALGRTSPGDPSTPLGAEELLAHGVPPASAGQLADALARLAAARSESDLLAAVRATETVLRTLPRAARGTLLQPGLTRA